MFKYHPKAVEKVTRQARKEAREEVRAEWTEWYRRLQSARAQGIPFDEPQPGETQRQPPEEGCQAVHHMTPTHGPEPEHSSTDADDLQVRLDRANRHFRRKAAAVLNDETALRLLAAMYSKVVVETENFDFCQHGQALAKLTAANFCEISANSIYITKPGLRLIDNINRSES